MLKVNAKILEASWRTNMHEFLNTKLVVIFYPASIQFSMKKY